MTTRAPVERGDPRLLLELTRRVTATLDLQEVLDETFAALRRLADFGGGSIQLIDDEGYLVLAATDPPATPEARSFRIPVGQGVGGTIAVTGEPIYIPDIWSDPRVHPEGKRRATSPGVCSWFGVPLILHGAPIGVLQIDSPREDAFGVQERALLLAFTPIVAAAVQSAQVHERERETIERLREAERLKRDFLALVPHELRTPLTTLVGFGHTLAHHAEELNAATVADIGARVWRAGRRLERVMSDLLDLANIERGVFRADIAPIDVEPILLETAREQHDEDREIAVAVSPGLPPAIADGPRLRQIVGNLLSNARKYSPAGSSIDIHAARENGGVAISVTDDGPGIAPEMRERIFDAFFQVDPAETRAHEGLGIGLYVVRLLCERMGARVSVEDSPGRGARFVVRLPAAA